MKRGLIKFGLIIGSALITVFSAIKYVAGLIGYATIADDAKDALGIAAMLFDMAVALPWWAIWWPLVGSYFVAAGIAFDFSFDIFKRKSKPISQTKLERLDVLSSHFMYCFDYIKSENSNFISSEDKISAASELEIFLSRLSESRKPTNQRRIDSRFCYP